LARQAEKNSMKLSEEHLALHNKKKGRGPSALARNKKVAGVNRSSTYPICESKGKWFSTGKKNFP